MFGQPLQLSAQTDQRLPGCAFMTRALYGPRASMGHVVSTTPPRTPTIHSCRLTVGSQWLGASCTVEPIGSRPAHMCMDMHMHMHAAWMHHANTGGARRRLTTC